MRRRYGSPSSPPAVDAFALAIIAAGGPPAFPGFPAPDRATAGTARSGVRAAMAALRRVAPATGAYVNECDYFQRGWQKAFWGSNYSRLARVKRHYDPDGWLCVHHGVGSEQRERDGG